METLKCHHQYWIKVILGTFLLIFIYGYAHGQLISQSGWSLFYVDSEEPGSGEHAVNAFDGSTTTRWHSEWMLTDPDPPPPHEIQIDLGAVYNLSGFRYLPRQDGMKNGMVDDYRFYISSDGANWGSPVAQGVFAANSLEKEVLFSQTTGRYVRFEALSEVNGKPWTSMAELNLVGSLATGNNAPNGVIDAPDTNVTILVGGSVSFNGTGNDPDNDLPLSYNWNFGSGSGITDSAVEDPASVQFNNAGVFTVTFTVTDALGLSDPSPATVTVTVNNPDNQLISQSGWSLFYVDSEEPGSGEHAVNAFDGSTTTRWHSEWMLTDPDPPPPHEIQIDLGAVYNLSGFRYLPRQDGMKNGMVDDYRFYISSDGANWGSPVAQGVFAANSLEKEVLFSQTTGRYVRFEALSEVNGKPWTSMAELNLVGFCVIPSVTITEPQDNHLQTGNEIYVHANACLENSQQGVKFIIDGGPSSGGAEYSDYNPPYEIVFDGMNLSEHVVEAFVIDGNGDEVAGQWAYDQIFNVGIGTKYVAIGDSITFGVGDNNAADNISNDGRNSGGGFEPILNNLLTSYTNYPNSIFNEGVEGAMSIDGATSINEMLFEYPDSTGFLVLYGTNDSNIFLPVPSGKGLDPGDPGYPGTYKDNMQQIVNAVKNAGKEVALAKVPVALADCKSCDPYPDPLDTSSTTKNKLIEEYNAVIDELYFDAANNIMVIPPDFFNYFGIYYENEYADWLHPNGIGYNSMAELWFNALTP